MADPTRSYPAAHERQLGGEALGDGDVVRVLSGDHVVSDLGESDLEGGGQADILLQLEHPHWHLPAELPPARAGEHILQLVGHGTVAHDEDLIGAQSLLNGDGHQTAAQEIRMIAPIDRQQHAEGRRGRIGVDGARRPCRVR